MTAGLALKDSTRSRAGKSRVKYALVYYSTLVERLTSSFAKVQFAPRTVPRFQSTVSETEMAFAWKAAGLTYEVPSSMTRNCEVLTYTSYNRYLAVAARVVRRSLKEQPRLQAEKRGDMDLKFAKWEVSLFNRGNSKSVKKHSLR